MSKINTQIYYPYKNKLVRKPTKLEKIIGIVDKDKVRDWDEYTKRPMASG